MRTIGIRTLRSQLSECIRMAGSGKEQYHISCHGKIVALLCRKDQAENHPADSPSNAPESEIIRFSIDNAISKEIQNTVRLRVHELQSMTVDALRETFKNETGYLAPSTMTKHELQLACGRAFQYKMWIEQVGAVPGDIGLRDLAFWYQLLLPQNLSKNN